jgi:hypothetical protein
MFTLFIKNKSVLKYRINKTQFLINLHIKNIINSKLQDALDQCDQLQFKKY